MVFRALAVLTISLGCTRTDADHSIAQRVRLARALAAHEPRWVEALARPGADAGMAFDFARGRVVLFGGTGLLGALDDTWEVVTGGCACDGVGAESVLGLTMAASLVLRRSKRGGK